MAERKALVLRISPELYEALHRLAAEEMRSVNAEIEFLLRQGVLARGRKLKSPEGEPDQETP